MVTAKSISKLNGRFECFVYGCDQIWNPIGWQPTLFFDILPDDKKRISYAARIARDKLTEEEYAYMQPYLDKFSGISVREKNAAEMLNQKFPDLNVQAMACGCAVVSSYRGVLKYAIDGENSLLSPVRDVDTMVNNIVRLFEVDELRAKISANGVKTGKERSLEKSAQKFEKVLLNCI